MRPRCSLPPSRKGAAGKARGEMGECDRATERVKLGTHCADMRLHVQRSAGGSLFGISKNRDETYDM